MKVPRFPMRTAAKLLAAAAVTTLAVGTYLIACMPEDEGISVFSRAWPANPRSYARGEVGMVKPLFPRRYLVQAYRVYTEQPAVVSGGLRSWEQADPGPGPGVSSDAWLELQQRVLGGVTIDDRQKIAGGKAIKDYHEFTNCLDDAFATALNTADARIATYGEASREVREWVRAQAVVFSNCGGPDLALPAPAPEWADESLRADREYQTAAAYFYGMRYEEAARRFRAIAADTRSSWRPYGTFLAARAAIREATVPDHSTSEAASWFAAAERDLQSVLADSTAASLHTSARRLLDFIEFRAHPIERLRRLSARLATSPTPSEQEFVDYEWLMDLFIGDTTRYGYEMVKERDAITADAMNDWIIAFQASGDDAIARIAERWEGTRALPWLVAALWRLPRDHASVPGVLAAAAEVPRTSPAFPTVAALRVRTLIQRGDRTAARSALASLPVETEAGIDAETLNVLRAERLALASSIEEFLDNAPRANLEGGLNASDTSPRKVEPPTFDEDAALVLNQRMSVERLIAIAGSRRLPERLRGRVAAAAFARSLVLDRTDAARRVAPTLRALSPQLRADIDRYIRAGDPARRRFAAVLLLLRAPRLSAAVGGVDRESEAVLDAPRKFDRFGANWWCGIPRQGMSATMEFLYGSGDVAFPGFIDAGERKVVEDELSTLARRGTAREFMMREAIAWGKQAPTNDVLAAEALARSIAAWRRSRCSETSAPELPRQAFALLHRSFPDTDWARRTRYWYQ